VNLLVKSDGTHLYNAKDLALAAKKERDFAPDRSVIVLDVRQSLVMQQLFATLHKMGMQKEFFHLSFGQVALPDGAMSSRKGNFIRYDDVMARMMKLAAAETKKRHADWSDKKVARVVRALSYGAVKFSMLRVDPDKPIVFDMKEALSFDGYHVPYLFYTLARCRGVLGKSHDRDLGNVHTLHHPEEERLVRLVAEFPGVILETALDYRISRLSQYLFDVAQSFSRWYAAVSLAAEKEENIRKSRLRLVAAVSQTIKNGLKLLGIEPLEEM
jgi:arginyl-tRNA synthetase